MALQTNGSRVPPHDLDAEESILGALLLGASDVAGLRAEDFYAPGHGHIFAAVVEGQADGETIDPVTVAARLRARGLLEAAGGAAALVTLQANASSLSAGTHARIVIEHSRRRRMLGLAAELTEAAHAGDDEAMARVSAAIVELPEVGRSRLDIEDVTGAVAGDEPAILPTLLRFEA